MSKGSLIKSLRLYLLIGFVSFSCCLSGQKAFVQEWEVKYQKAYDLFKQKKNEEALSILVEIRTHFDCSYQGHQPKEFQDKVLRDMARLRLSQARKALLAEEYESAEMQLLDYAKEQGVKDFGFQALRESLGRRLMYANAKNDPSSKKKIRPLSAPKGFLPTFRKEFGELLKLKLNDKRSDALNSIRIFRSKLQRYDSKENEEFRKFIIEVDQEFLQLLILQADKEIDQNNLYKALQLLQEATLVLNLNQQKSDDSYTSIMNRWLEVFVKWPHPVLTGLKRRLDESYISRIELPKKRLSSNIRSLLSRASFRSNLGSGHYVEHRKIPVLYSYNVNKDEPRVEFKIENKVTLRRALGYLVRRAGLEFLVTESAIWIVEPEHKEFILSANLESNISHQLPQHDSLVHKLMDTTIERVSFHEKPLSQALVQLGRNATTQASELFSNSESFKKYSTLNFLPGYDPEQEDPLVTYYSQNASLFEIVSQLKRKTGYFFQIRGNVIAVTKDPLPPPKRWEWENHLHVPSNNETTHGVLSLNLPVLAFRKSSLNEVVEKLQAEVRNSANHHFGYYQASMNRIRISNEQAPTEVSPTVTLLAYDISLEDALGMIALQTGYQVHCSSRFIRFMRPSESK